MMVFRSGVLSNAPLDILFSEFGRSIATNPLSRKAFSPIIATWLGSSNATVVRPEQP
jgi:hypothetical protein